VVLTEINSDQFRDMVRAATHRMGKNAEFVNKLNIGAISNRQKT